MIPMPGKIIVKQDGGSEKRGGILVSQRFAEKDRPMTGRVLAVGAGKPCELTHGDVLERVNGWDVCRSPEYIADEILRICKLERQSLPVSVKAGDRVVFQVFQGHGIEWIEEDGSRTMCRCLEESEILAKIID